jgi:hypothetical protein
MPITSKIVASELLMCGIKKILVAGPAIEIIDSIRSKAEAIGRADRLNEMEAQLSRFEKRQRDLVAEEMRAILKNLAQPDLSGPKLTEEIRNLKQIQEQGWNTNLFEGLLANCAHLDELKRNPTQYGDLIDDHSSIK